MSDVSEKIAKLLEDPESLKMISEIAGSFIGGTSPNNDDAKKDLIPLHEKTEQDTHDNSQLYDSTVLSATIGKLINGSDIENTVRLVTALRPYMSARRRESADSVIRILGIMKIVGNSNFAEMAKLFGTHGK